MTIILEGGLREWLYDVNYNLITAYLDIENM